ncbi:DNA polymerase III subunit gamma/tau [bacterium]|nr:DNA polymerase III subunit gamma/tau [bacterium]
MSYLVLARKWRPQTFDDVVGQEHITRTLERAINKNRIAHAYLFTGPRGIGKTTTARILAKALNCLDSDKPTSHPCNKCISCIEITDGRSTDVLEIDGASHRGIDDARELQTNIQYATSGRYKVIIIDEVHMLTKEAFNSLLKTLEEPPANVVFVFATTEPDQVPLTIISRCQRFDFRRVSPKLISRHIRKIAKNENFDITDDAADFIAIRADGAVRDSLSMLDQIFASEPEQIDVELVMSLLGVVPVQSFQRIAESVGSKDPSLALTELADLLEHGIDPLQIGKGLVEHFRNALIAKSNAMDKDYPNYELYAKIASARSLQDLLRIMRVLTDSYNRMRRSDTPRYIMEETSIYLALIDDVVDVSQLIQTVRSGDFDTPVHREKVSQSQKPAPQVSKRAAPISQTDEQKGIFNSQKPNIEKQRSASIPDESSDEEKLPDDPKERFLTVLMSMHKAMAGLLKHIEIILDDRRVLLKFPESMETVREELMVNSEQFKLLKQSAWKAFGPDVEIDLVREKNVPQKKPLNKENSNIPEQVEEILNIFDAKLEG